MAYQASVGQKVFYSTAYAMTSPVELVGLTSTPAKGGEPETISVNIISEKFVRNLVGQQSIETMAYAFVPDFSTNGNVKAAGTAIAASQNADLWIYEEYEEGVDTTSGSSTTHTLGAGVLYKGKFKSMSVGEQEGNSAQTASLYAQLTGKSIYICSGGESPTYVDLFTGNAVTTPE